jgi:hypothetical protein
MQPSIMQVILMQGQHKLEDAAIYAQAKTH